MKKKKIITIIVICVLVHIVLCAIVGSLMYKRLNNTEKRGYVETSLEFLQQDEAFCAEYGKILSFETEDNYPPNRIEYENKSESYMTFACETEKATFEIRVFHIWENA